MPSFTRRWRSRRQEPVPAVATAEVDVRDAFLADPEDRKVFDRWLKELRGSGLSDEAVCDALAEVQDEVFEPVPLVLAHLLAHDTLEEPWRRRFASQLAVFAESERAQACRQVWADYSHLRPLDATACAQVRTLPPVVRLLFFLTAVPPYRRVGGLTDTSWKGGKEVPAKVPWEEAVPDIDFDWVQRSVRDFLTPEIPGSSQPDTRRFASESIADLVANRMEPYTRFQERLFRGGGLPIPDPLDPGGVPLQPFDAMMAFDRTVYSYAGRELFFLIVGLAGGRALGLYLPARNVLLDFEAAITRVLSGSLMANLFTQVLTRLIRVPDLYNEAVGAAGPASAEQSRSLVVNVGRAENFAHHLWNYYPGLLRLVEAGCTDRVAEVHSAGTEFFGPIQGIFPELASATLVRHPRGAIWDPCPFSTDHVITQPGGYFITTALIERLTEAMAALPVVDQLAHQPVFAGERPFPIVWIGLRVGSRSWLDQETQVPELIRRMQDRYPNALFLLDGFSYPLGEDLVTAKWSGAIDQLRELADAMVAACADPVNVLSLVGNTLRESVLWAREVDTYLTPLGTSQHKVGWFTEAPGAVFGPRKLAEVGGSPRRLGAWAAEGITLPAFVIGEPAEAGERRSTKDMRWGLENLRLDVDELVETMCSLVEQRQAQLSS